MTKGLKSRRRKDKHVHTPIPLMYVFEVGFKQYRAYECGECGRPLKPRRVK